MIYLIFSASVISMANIYILHREWMEDFQELILYEKHYLSKSLVFTCICEVSHRISNKMVLKTFVGGHYKILVM